MGKIKALIKTLLVGIYNAFQDSWNQNFVK